jgi:hypothetical protein
MSQLVTHVAYLMCDCRIAAVVSVPHTFFKGYLFFAGTQAQHDQADLHRKLQTALAGQWRPGGLLPDDVCSTLLGAACTLIATLHAHAPRMPASLLSDLSISTFYTTSHPRCALFAAVQLLRSLVGRSSMNAGALLTSPAAEQLLTMREAAVYGAFVDDVAALFITALEHSGSLLLVCSLPASACPAL